MTMALLVFIFYINDVIHNVPGLLVYMHADDCFTCTIGNNCNLMSPKIQEGLNSFQTWRYKNCLNSYYICPIQEDKGVISLQIKKENKRKSLLFYMYH